MSDTPEQQVSVAEARSIAYRYLGNREHSRQELVQKLSRRGVPADVATIAVDELATEDLVSDQRFAESFVRSRVGRFQGPIKIKAELKRKGIDPELAEFAVSAHERDWIEVATTWVRRRARIPLDYQEQGRLYRNGGNRGFSHEQLMAAIHAVREETGDEADPQPD